MVDIKVLVIIKVSYITILVFNYTKSTLLVLYTSLTLIIILRWWCLVLLRALFVNLRP